MAETRKKKEAVKAPKQYIDPVYQKYTDSVVSALGTDEFYQFFRENLNRGKRSYQFSNRKLEKTVDERWVKAIEDCMEAFRNIITNPRNFIMEQEEIVNVAVARQSTPDVIRHLTTHGMYIDEISDDNVRPNHLLNKFKEDTWNTYENRFVYTLLEKTTEFVSKRFEAIFAHMGEEFGAFLKVEAEAQNKKDIIRTNFDIRIKQNDDYYAKEGDDIFSRIARLDRQLKDYMQSKFAQQLRKYARVKNPIVKTNAIQKNPNFKACYKLWVFIYNYTDVGYSINIYEQSNEITPEFEQDIYHSILFDYLILKNYLELPEDREIDPTQKFRKRVLKPKMIKKIIEEIVGNYDITDVEIRKILIEEFTKQQLIQLEEKERRQMVEQREREKAAKRKKEAEAKAREQKKRQLERAKQLREKEQEKARRVKALQKRQETIEKKAALCIAELDRFEEEKKTFLEKRALEEAKLAEEAKKAEEKQAAEEKKQKAAEKRRKAAEAKKAAEAAQKAVEKEAEKAAEIEAEAARKAAEAEVEAARKAAEAEAEAARKAAEAREEALRKAAEKEAEKAARKQAEEQKRLEEQQAEEQKRFEEQQAELRRRFEEQQEEEHRSPDLSELLAEDDDDFLDFLELEEPEDVKEENGVAATLRQWIRRFRR